MPFTILRYGIPYGPRMRPSLVIPIFMRKALGGEPMTVAGDGSQTPQVRLRRRPRGGHVLALRPRPRTRPSTSTAPKKVTILRIAETVHELVGGKGIEFVPARAGDYGGKQVSSAKAARERSAGRRK